MGHGARTLDSERSTLTPLPLSRKGKAMAEHATEIIIIITNMLVVLSTVALFMATTADVIKDSDRTLRDVVRLVLKAQRNSASRKGGE